MNVTDCLTGVEIQNDEDVIAIAMIEAKKEYGISLVSGAGAYVPQISAISFPITGKYNDYTIKADDNFASNHFLQLTGCSEWKETDKFIDATPNLFFPQEYKSDILRSKRSNRKEEVKKRYYPMGWSFFKKDTWNFIQNEYKKQDIKTIQNLLLKKLDDIDFDSNELYEKLSELMKDLSFKSYSYDNNILRARDSCFNYTSSYFMKEMYPLSLKNYEMIKSHIENVFPHEYAGLEQIVNVYNTFKNYDKSIGVSLRLGNSSYLPPNDLIALTLKQKTDMLIQKINEGYLEITDSSVEKSIEINNEIKNILNEIDNIKQSSPNMN